MTSFLRILALFSALIWAGAASAQTEEDDRGYLQAFLEDNLSDVGRDIRIIGFKGVFSSEATVDQITVADDEGIWLTLNDVVMEWTRRSLFRGVVNIDQLIAREIIIARQPIPVGGTPSPEANGFSLPELPVSVDIGIIKADRIEIAEPVIGEAAVVRLEGTAKLEDGEGAAQLSVTRTDGPDGALQFEGSFSNTTQLLDLQFAVQEGKDCIAANMLNLPGRPSVDLTIAGTGPMTDFVAEVDLTTDGEPRLTGQVEVKEVPDEDSSTADNPVTITVFETNLSGDLAPVFLPEYREFFGNSVTLAALGRRYETGAIELETLELSTKALQLEGELAISARGWPERFKLQGRIRHEDDTPVLLPVAAKRTRVQSADLAIGYDVRNSDAWQASFVLNNLTRDDLSLDTAKILASGTLEQESATSLGAMDGTVTLDLLGIAPKTDAVAKAVGPTLSGKLAFDWRQGAPLQISDIDLTGEDYALTGAVTASDFESGITVTTKRNVVLAANDLSQFAGLVGQSLTGVAKLAVDGSLNLLGGAFDLAITGDGDNIGVGLPRIDPLITGASKLDIKAVRDETGTRLERLNITTDQTRAALTADLKSDASSVQFDLKIKDSSVVDPGLTGPATATGRATQTGDVWAVVADLTGPGGVTASVDGTVQTDKGKPGVVQGQVSAEVASLSSYATLVGRPLSGSIAASGSGSYDLASGIYQAELDGTANDLGLGIATVDDLIRGGSTFSAQVHGTPENRILIDTLSITTPEVTAKITGTETEDLHTLAFDINLRDAGIVAVGLSGPGSASGTATMIGDNWQLAANATGPGGATGAVNGTIRSDVSSADLSIKGTAPLELVNRLIQPRRLTGQAAYDLTLKGPLKLASLSGQVQSSGARLVLPVFRQALEVTSATAVLSDGRASVTATATVVNGGQVSTRGTIGLDRPYQADLEVDIRQVTLTDGKLFDTTVNGTGTVVGPLIGGATLRADLDLGRTEIRISDVPASTVPIIAELQHINEPAAVRQTRVFAGLVVDTEAVATARPYPIDITLRAPNQVFVRGRGLDAEVGGELRLTGTSADVRPIGEFDLIRGRLDILGKRLELTEGRVSLRGAFNPYLAFAAEAQSEDILVRINVIGLASSPEVIFTSTPDLPEDEVLSRLLFGRSITEISALQALRLAAAVRTLAGAGGDGIVGNLRRNFALDDLDLTTDEDGEATLRIGKYLSENIYTDVTVGADGDTEVNLNLTISPSVTARGSVASDGESSIGIYFERDY